MYKLYEFIYLGGTKPREKRTVLSKDERTDGYFYGIDIEDSVMKTYLPSKMLYFKEISREVVEINILNLNQNVAQLIVDDLIEKQYSVVEYNYKLYYWKTPIVDRVLTCSISTNQAGIDKVISSKYVNLSNLSDVVSQLEKEIRKWLEQK